VQQTGTTGQLEDRISRLKDKIDIIKPQKMLRHGMEICERNIHEFSTPSKDQT
jgi:hypothetical protein